MLKSIKKIIPIFLLFILLTLNSINSPAMANAHDLAKVKILPYTIPATNKDNFIIAVDVTLKGNWKTYWKIAGDAGLSPNFDWSGSQNLKNKPEIMWPLPTRFEKYGIQNIGYKKHVIFPVKISVINKKKPVKASLNLTLLICDEICVPFEQKIEQTISLDPYFETNKKILASAIANLPQDLNEKSIKEIAVIQNSKNPALPKLYLALQLPDNYKGAKLKDIFIYNSESLFFDAPLSSQLIDKILTVEIPLRIELDEQENLADILKNDPNFSATLAFSNKDSLIVNLSNTKIININKDVKNQLSSSSNTQHSFFKNIWTMIAFAFLGGLILNVMPCVLPVLSLKFLSMVKSSNKKTHHIRAGFIASSFGILTTFWAMALVISFLKIAGHSIGWGMQFQNTYFLLFLVTIITIFAANLWGVFEINLPSFISRKIPIAKQSNTHSLTSHFMTGVLATILATPCSAPFLGTAVGFALGQDTKAIFIIFTFLGLGLAVPYIFVAIFPKIALYMPKPGKWMITVKKIMAVALLATAIWLGSIAANNIIGRQTQEITDGIWYKFSISRLNEEISKGKIVFVDITADWCITCKANKKFVIDDREIMQIFGKENIVLLVGDWTEMDDNLTSYINSFGKYGIPLNIIYGPNAKEGILLPELLSKTAIKDALKKAGLKN